jgi:nicotinic acetylcholine receptor
MKQRKILIYMCAFLIIVPKTAVRSASGSDMARLYKDLLLDYNRMVRPVIDQSQAVSVGVELHITNVRKLDERSQMLWMNGFMGLQWRDEYLTWNTSVYGDVTQIFLPNDQIWLPDLVVYNSVDNLFDIGGKEALIIVLYTGLVWWYPGGHYRTVCPVDVRKYPMDVQVCDIDISQWSSNVTTQILLPLGGEKAYDIESPTEMYLTHSDVQCHVDWWAGEGYVK